MPTNLEVNAPADQTHTIARRVIGSIMLGMLLIAVPLILVLTQFSGAIFPTALPSLASIATWSFLALSGMVVASRRIWIRNDDGDLHLGAEAPLSVLAAVWLSPTAAFAAGLVAGCGIVASARSHQSGSHARLRVAALVLSGAIATGVGSAAIRGIFGTPHADHYLAAAGLAAAIRVGILVTTLVSIRLISATDIGTTGGTSTLGALAVLELAIPTLSVGAAAPFYDTHWITLAIVLGASGVTAMALTALAQSTRHHSENRALRSAFGRFVSAPVADQVLSGNQEPLHAIADQRTITVLFCDVQGFTAWAETATPREVVTDLNDLLSGLASAVLATGGTIDKFTGDGLMAFWGAPVKDLDHAAKAVQTAPLLLMRAHEFNVQRRARGKAPLEIGIGIHTGSAIVGPVGHRDRMDYTAMGDTVNVAARLEAATRFQECPILLSESTFLKLPLAMQQQCARLVSIEVKGRKERIRLYAPQELARHLKVTTEPPTDELAS